MRADVAASAEILESLWKRFADNYALAYPGYRMTKGEFARLHIGDGIEPHALIRWTNPGKRPNWRIPLARIPEVARALKATEADLDALMQARLVEMEGGKGGANLATAMEWFAGLVERAARLPADEQAVLECYREATQNVPCRLLHQKHAREALTKHFRALASEALSSEANNAAINSSMQRNARHVLLRLGAAGSVKRLWQKAAHDAEVAEIVSKHPRKRVRSARLAKHFTNLQATAGQKPPHSS